MCYDFDGCCADTSINCSLVASIQGAQCKSRKGVVQMPSLDHGGRKRIEEQRSRKILRKGERKVGGERKRACVSV